MYDLPANEPTSGFEKFSDIFGSIGSFILESIEAIVVALAISVVLYLFLFTPHEIVGTSMVPTFQSGEYVIANKIVYRYSEPRRGDVIIFKFSPTQDFIKRIIAIPGDQISLRDGKFILNGELLDESEYLAETVFTQGGDGLKEGQTLTVPEGKVFASGDNRPHSSDSRAFGPIEIDDIRGKAWLVFLPFNRIRIVEHPG